MEGLVPYAACLIGIVLSGYNVTNPPVAVAVANASGFVPAFISSFLLILGSEIGDKTFFIAAILSMKNSHVVVFAGAISALVLMTILSAGLGVLLPSLLSKEVTHYTCTALFVYFGIRLLYDVYTSDATESENEELKEVEMELQVQSPNRDEEGGGGQTTTVLSSSSRVYHTVLGWFSSTEVGRVYMQAFAMTFLAEWGDRSQIATIALATSKNPIGVAFGGFVGHSLCTGLAVIGGKLLASSISERHVNMAGGCLFLVFALASLVMGVE